MSFIKFLFSVNGRINRHAWWYYVFCAPAIHAFLVAMVQITQNGRYSEFTPMFVLLFLPLLFADFAVCAKRFQDLGYTGWNALIGFVPIFGWAYIIISCGCHKGTDGDNKYGPPAHNIFE
jgi:uncharacterized membrane protein YhaH (DUF805 family)